MNLSRTISTFALLICTVLNLTGVSQNIPSYRIIDWSKAGSNCIDNSADTIFLEQLGNSGDLNIYFDSLFYQAQDSLILFGGGTIIIPAGTFLINATLNLQSNITIQGQGYLNTILQFDLSGANIDPVKIQGSSASIYDTIVTSPQKGNTIFEVIDASIYQIGQAIRMVEDDNGRIFSSWASNNIGQVFSIEAIDLSSNTITMDRPSRLDFDMALNPRIQTFNTKKNIKICALKIDRLDATSSQTSNISFRLAENCIVEGIESNNSNFAHLEINISKDITVSNSYFHHGHNYGGGGQGYGVVIQATSGDVLITNNIFNHLRHSVLLQSCANGNVISYNYSIDPHWTGVSLPSNSAGDMVLHGNFPYLNLFEGNICQNIVIDNSHGINGHHNTFFRNRGELYGLFMNNSPASDSQNFIGNEISSTALFQGFYTLEGTNHYEFGNNHKGTTKPAGTSNLSLTTMYLDNYPSSWSLNLSEFPTIGYPNAEMGGAIPTSVNYLNSEFAECKTDTAIFTGLFCHQDSILLDGIWHSSDTSITSSMLKGKCQIPIKYELNKANTIIIDQVDETLAINLASVIGYQWNYNNSVNGNYTSAHLCTQNGAYYCEVTLTENSVSTTCSSDTISINGLHINENNMNYKLYPNPGNAYLILEVDQKCSILLQSQLGETIYSADISHQLRLPTQKLAPGMYNLVIINSKGLYKNLKWIKQ